MNKNKNYIGRSGMIYSAEMLVKLLSDRALSVQVFGAPAPKFINHQQMHDWCLKQIQEHERMIENLQTLGGFATNCLGKVYGECKECDQVLDLPATAKTEHS